MNAKKLFVKIIFTLVLTMTATLGAGVVAEQMGAEITPNVYACGAAGGGGC